MAQKKYILLEPIISHYKIDLEFVYGLQDMGRIDIKEENNVAVLPENQLDDFQKMIRMKNELNINTEGIDAIFNLLDQIETMQQEISTLHEKLRYLDKDWN